MLDESCFTFNLNRSDVGDYRCSLARGHTISEIFDRILKPVYLLQSAKMFTWEMLEFFIDRKSKEFPRIVFCTINSFKILIRTSTFFLPVPFLLRLDQSSRLVTFCLEGSAGITNHLFQMTAKKWALDVSKSFFVP